MSGKCLTWGLPRSVLNSFACLMVGDAFTMTGGLLCSADVRSCVSRSRS